LRISGTGMYPRTALKNMGTMRRIILVSSTCVMLQSDQAPVFPVSTAALSRQLKKHDRLVKFVQKNSERTIYCISLMFGGIKECSRTYWNPAVLCSISMALASSVFICFSSLKFSGNLTFRFFNTATRT
jgi:hypothetical protein